MKAEEPQAEDDPELRARLRPLGGVRLDEALAVAARELAVQLEDESVRSAAFGESRRTSRRRSGVIVASVLAAVLAAGIAVPVTAVANWLSARTGDYGDTSRGTQEDNTEWLNLAGEDLPAVIAEAYPDGLQLPASLGREDAIERVDATVSRLGSEPNSFVQEGAITTTFEFWAICAWYDEWLDADADDESARRAVASDWLLDQAHYPSIVANDGGGVVDRLQEIARSAAAGDRSLVEAGYGESACDGLLGRDE
ncbi:hypothetical protein BJ978_001432 [Agromyces terreus]|uniref:Uncharacterized protein n=1 Tax=Agromyces terreus TaxID=424795 RepID=A0A9X2H072_9MICO|nr:hypothetical protein [Agromyces terreus]MCP2370756.1 hypothetical protein [Agromyces terreus]